MLSSEASQRRHALHRVLPVLALSMVAALSAACGFRPLYGNGSGVRQDATRVRIEPIADRQGQILRNELIDRLNPRGAGAAAPYRLTVDYRENLAQLAIRRDDTATRANLNVWIRFRLVEASSGVLVYAGRSSATSSYNLVQSDYANLVSRRAAQRRAAKLLADDISTQVAIYFNRIRRLQKTKPKK